MAWRYFCQFIVSEPGIRPEQKCLKPTVEVDGKKTEFCEDHNPPKVVRIWPE